MGESIFCLFLLEFKLIFSPGVCDYASVHIKPMRGPGPQLLLGLFRQLAQQYIQLTAFTACWPQLHMILDELQHDFHHNFFQSSPTYHYFFLISGCELRVFLHVCKNLLNQQLEISYRWILFVIHAIFKRLKEVVLHRRPIIGSLFVWIKLKFKFLIILDALRLSMLQFCRWVYFSSRNSSMDIEFRRARSSLLLLIFGCGLELFLRGSAFNDEFFVMGNDITYITHSSILL